MTATSSSFEKTLIGCLAAFALAFAVGSGARADISSAESPLFTFDALRCVPEPEVRIGAETSEAFAFDALRCVPEPGVRTASAESAPSFMSYMPWDTNVDCNTNILDLIFVRNHLRDDAESGENWRADVNRDGAINILDLLEVRNKLRTSCQE